MRHIEFIHTSHFEDHYYRHCVTGRLSLFIDYFWQTNFEKLWVQYPKGFSDMLFPNLGYTYLVNLGTPFTMQVGKNKIPMKGDGFLPRFSQMEAFHKPGNSLFGIKFKVSPVIFEKEVDFSEYSDAVYPLSYLLEPELITGIKKAAGFDKRVKLLSRHYEKMLDTYQGSLQPVNIVTSIFDACEQRNVFNPSVEELAGSYGISARTLQRYFKTTTGMSSKRALQVLRIRKALHTMISHPKTFDHSQFGYYDLSHYYKHLKQFLHKDSLMKLNPYLKLLQTVRKK
ncbi:MAG: helix-turn-helix domain-containing protein [Bacteroidota bacterium]